MKNALIIHGVAGSSKGNWYQWLKKELEIRGYKVWIPDLPNPTNPNKDNWINTIFSNNKWVFDKDSLIIGHSAGATLTLKVLEKIPVWIKIQKAILVAGAASLGENPKLNFYKKLFISSGFDWMKIKNASNKFYFICSDKDPYECGIDKATIMQEHLGGEVILKKGQGHFNIEKGPKYKKFPFLLTLID